MKSINSNPTSSSSSHPRQAKRVYLCISLFAALLTGCEGLRYEKMLTAREPFQSMIGQRVTLQRPIQIRKSPADVFNFPAGWLRGPGRVSGEILPPEDCAWVVHEITRDSFAGSKTETWAATPKGLGIPTKLPAGTVIQFESFRRIQDNWFELPGNVPLGRHPAMYFVHFSVPGRSFPVEMTSQNGRRVQTKTLLEYRWGYGHELWPAPWEPKDKPATVIW
jgi:hypothetical protein